MKTQTFRRYGYDHLDVRIVEMLGKEGPRNIYKISRILNMPESTIRHRINMMKQKDILKLHTNIYHTNIGLKKAVVFAGFNPIYFDDIEDFMEIVPYWAYIERLHCFREGIYTLYTIPPQYQNHLKEFLDEMVSLGILDSYELLWSTCFHRVNTTTTWYNLKREGWDFRWNELINEVDQASIELPVTLRDPDDFPILADEIDIFILKELEKDATISLSDLAKMLGTSIQNVHYHFKKHIEGRFLIEDYQIVFKKFDLETSVFPRFIIEFPNHQYLAKTANVFRNKPFTEVLGKILDTNKLLVAAYLPLKEFFNMLRTLNRMVALGIIKSYNYRIVYPLEKSERQTIPYKNFQKGSWIFEADKYIERLHELHRKLGTTAG